MILTILDWVFDRIAPVLPPPQVVESEVDDVLDGASLVWLQGQVAEEARKADATHPGEGGAQIFDA